VPDLAQLLDPRPIEGKIDNNGFYEPVRYRDWGYVKSARNPQEDEGKNTASTARPQLTAPDGMNVGETARGDIGAYVKAKKATNGHFDLEYEKAAKGDHYEGRYDNLPARHLRPRLLCFRTDYTSNINAASSYTASLPSASRPGYEVLSPEEWVEKHGEGASTEFIFVSYTRAQFVVATKDEIAEWRDPQGNRYNRGVQNELNDQSTIDRDYLTHFGERAARSAGVPAFWIDFLCLPAPEPLGYELQGTENASWIPDVFRICDVSRAAHSMIIVVGPTNKPLPGTRPTPTVQTNSTQRSPDDEIKSKWLHEWGERLWTLPEVLLCPAEHRITIHYLDENPPKPEKLIELSSGRPETLAKRNFALRAYEDGKVVRELIDHYEGSLILTPLELVTKALECLWRRKTDNPKPGDQSYALMGLLRRRPDVNYNDSAFEAFARLSLANDSNLLLERLICMMPKRRGQGWHVMLDAWGVNLWDIEPSCQVAGIVDNRTVLLDGAFGATIQWHALKPVGYVKRKNVWREAGKVCLRLTPGWFFIGVLTIAVAPKNTKGSNPTLGIGAFFLAFTLVVLLLSPWLYLNLYRGKFWSVQACLFGIEGPVDLPTIEKSLFGFDHGRLKWSTNGSTLSRHRLRNGQCVPLSPSDTGIGNQDGRLFTLVDTYTMTATRFRAERPPVTVLICGREGGMQRAILCSYDWKTNTFCRETVLRMKTLILEKMFRVDRFRFALSRDMLQDQVS
jgi:hypothetical protein